MRRLLWVILVTGLPLAAAGCSDDDDENGNNNNAVNLCEGVDCGSHGACVETTGLCQCDAGYGGEACQLQVAVDFEDLSLPPSSHYIGDATGIQSFESGSATFLLYYDDTWGEYWEGIAATNETDTTTAGYENQFSAIAGAGEGGSETYGVAYTAGFEVEAELRFPGAGAGVTVAGLYVTNTTFAYLAMRDGDDFSKKFGGADGTDPDWFRLTAYGIGSGGQTTGSVELYLADFRSGDPAAGVLVSEWTWMELLSLGPVVGLRFGLESSDEGEFGMNTPAYFAFDSIYLQP